MILAGGVNYREKKQGTKVLQNFGESSLLESQFKVLRHTYPKAIVTVTVGFQAERIIKVKGEASAIENQCYNEQGTTEELRLYFNAFNPSRLLMIDGSIYFNEEAVRVSTGQSSVLTYETDDTQEVGIHIEDGKVSHLSYGLDTKWSGIVYLDGPILEKFKKVCSRNNSKLFLYESLNLLLDKSVNIVPVYSNKAQIVKF